MKKALLALAVAGAAVSAQADVSLSGHVNYAMGNTEDFTDDKGLNVYNNDLSGTRFRIVASTEANGITYGTHQELGLNDGGTARIEADDAVDDGGNGDGIVNTGEVDVGNQINVRVSQFTIGGDFGQFSLGQGWESGDDISELDFSGTYVAGSGAGGYNVGGTQTDNIDGGRDNRLRYDSPKIGGVLNIAADYDEDDSFGLSLLAGGDNWSAGIFTEGEGDESAASMGGSVAIKVAGFTAALQLGTADNSKASNSGDTDYQAVILGYNVGKTSVAIHTETREKANGAGVKSEDNTSTGISFAYRPTAGVELYAGYRIAESNIGDKIYDNDSDDKGSAFAVGGKVTF